MSNVSRRSFLVSTAVVVPAVALASSPVPSPVPSNAPEPPAVGASFPTQEPDLAREMVGVSHGNLDRVKELVGRHATLAKAAWDWGFGDWETALGAASHVGNRPIAEFLLANGAHPTIFSAAMLGQLDVVKAFVARMPGIQRTKGPHSITLLKHALAGGPPAQAVVEYLSVVGGADEKPDEKPLSAEDASKLVGTYAFGRGAGDRLEVTFVRERLWLARGQSSPRGLFHLGSLEFCPVGAEAVRVRFSDGAEGVAVTIHDPNVVLRARKSA